MLTPAASSRVRLSHLYRLLTLILVMVLLTTSGIVSAPFSPGDALAASASHISSMRADFDTPPTEPCPPAAQTPITPALIYLGPTSGTVFHPLTFAAQLTDGSGMPLAGRSLSLSLGSQSITVATDANGLAQATGVPSDVPGPLVARASFAGDATAAAATVTRTLVIARQETVLTYLGALPGTSPTQQITVRLGDADSQQPIAGVPLQFSLGGGSASATTDATGVATGTLTFSIEQAISGVPLQVSFAGDAYRAPAQLSVPASISFPAVFGSVVVRHAPTLSGQGRVNGTLRLLSGEDTALNGGAVITGDVLVPGTPTVKLNGDPPPGGIVQGPGNPLPNNYTITLNGHASFGRLMTRIDPIPMAAVPAPPAPAGTRDVQITQPGQSIGDPATLRNLTLGGNVGPIVVPPGSYGQFTANSASALIFGLAGATQPAIYNLQSLNLTSGSELRVAGPIILTVATSIDLYGHVGTVENPRWLTLNVASGGITLNGGSEIDGIVRATSGTVLVRGQGLLRGVLFADRLTVNDGGVIEGVLAASGSSPVLTSRQVSPATALPGQTFNTTLAITNTGSVTATQVLVQERFTNTTPTSATATFAVIAPSSSASTIFAQTAPALVARSAGESQPDYLARLAAADGLRLRANGTISYTALSGQAYPPLNVVSATGLSLPRLVLGLSAPACVGPGSQIAYIVRVANLGSAPATNASAQISFPDGSTASLALGTIAAGGVVNQTRTWAVPTIAARQTSDPADEDPAEGETSAAYLDRLRAADGTQLSAHVSLDWQDSRGTAYGSLAQQIASTERVPILTLTPQIPTTLVPGQTALLQFTVQNTGGGNAGSVQVQVANPDGTSSVATTPAIPAGETRTLQTSWAVPTADPKGATESDADYQARLAIFDTSLLHFGMLLSWADAATNPYGITSANAQSATPVPIVPISMEGPSSAQAGSTITYTIHLINNGHATATALDLRLTTITGSTQTVASGGPLVPGEQRQFSVPFTIPSSQPGGPATAVARVTWQDSGSNSYGPLSAQVTTSISALATPTPTVAPTATPAPSPLDGATLTLAPSSAGPNVTGTQQQMMATLKDRFGAAIAGVSISFVVSGPNATSASATTNAAGVASFSYTGANNGTDTIQATATSGSVTLVSNTASVGWVTPVQQISTTTVWGRFFTNPRGSVAFDKLISDTPVFTQTFPTLNFNPVSGSVPGAPAGLNQDTRPFTNVTTDLNGHYTGSIVAQGNGYVAGLGPLTGFEAVFTGAFIVKEASTLTLTMYSDDGYNWGVGPDKDGHQPYRNGSSSAVTLYNHFPVLNTNNGQWGYSTVTVTFPAAGMYPYEINFAENGPGGVSFSVLTAASGNHGVPPSGVLTISPNSAASKPTGQQQSFTVTATDASGVALSALPVTLAITGPNGQHVSAITNAAGQATFSYTGAYPGTDTVQAIAWVSGIAVYSAQVNVPWTVGAPPQPAAPLSIPGWLGGPANQSSVSGLVPITLASGITLQTGTITYWPADDSSAVTTLATNVHGSGGATLATLDTTALANGSYIISLSGTNSSGVQVNSGILITVVGEYKPGRVRFSVTDLTVPVTGLPITIGRTYDSLERSRSGDFGYGWSLDVSRQDLEVDQAHNVTLTQPDGRRVTFSFTPRSIGGFFGFLLLPSYTPQAGVYGSLSANGCGLMVSSGGQYICFLDDPIYNPSSYTYTDPYGRVFTIDADGSLRSISDLNGSVLTFNDEGITSNVDGRGVAFRRDAQNQNRITAVEVKNSTGGVVSRYDYAYSAAGDLDTVTLPAPQAGQARPVIQYFYDPTFAHLYQSVKDPLGHTLSSSTYYGAGDPPAKAGRLKSTTNWLDATTSFTFGYDYDLTNNSITITNPDGGHVVNRYVGQTLPGGNPASSEFKLTSQTIDVRVEGGQTKTHTTRFGYDTSLNLTTVGLPDPISGVAAAPSSTPGTCAARNICYTYDSRGNRTSITDPLGKTTMTEYNNLNRPTRETDPLANVRNLTYDSFGNFTGMSDSVGVLGGYTYDEHGNPQTFFLGNTPSHTTSYTYDQYGNLLTRTDPLGNVTQLAGYDTFGRVGSVTETSSTGPTRVTSYAYNDLGSVTSLTQPLNDGSGRSYTTSFGYDTSGNRTYEVNQTTGWRTDYSYYFDGQLKQQTQPDGTTRQYTYDWRGNPLTETDEAGNVTRYQYDLAGELIATTRADGTADAATERYDYDLAGRKIGETDGDNHTTQIQYDAADRIRFVIDPVHGATHPTEYRYDDAGRMVRMIDVRGIQTQYTYDQRRFPSQITYAFGTPDAQIERQTHDGRGNLLSVTDRNEKTTTYTYDADDRLETVTDALDHTTRYSRDRWGNVLTITDANSHQTSFTYDALGRVTQKTWPDGSTERYTYDEQIGSTPATSFSKVSHQLADGNINTTYYDAQGRMSRADYFDGETARYVYTPTGMPQEVLDQRGMTCYSYDDQDRVVDISYLGSGPGLVCGQSPARQRVGYAYDDIGNRVGMTMASGGTTRTLSYAYDANDRLCSISTAATPTPCGVTNSSTFAYNYDDQARTRRLTYPNGIVATSTYDPFNHLRSLQQTLSGQVLASYTYTLDAVGNRTRLDEGDGSVTTWEYDDTYRLRREQRQAGGSNPPSGSSWDTRYTYDAVGNRLTKTDVSGATSAATSYSYRPNGLDQIDHITLPGGSQLPYSYDQRGNLLSDGVATYSYNAHDLLSGVAVGGHSRSYSYDAEGRRFSQTADGVTTNYLWDEASEFGDVIAELSSADAVLTSYVLGDAEVLAQAGGAGTQMLLHDGHGSTSALADSSGTLIERYLYDAFGNLRAASGVPQTSYLYVGQQFDAGTGLYNLRTRSYQPESGRFLTRDNMPSEPGNTAELNRYIYTANNPVNAIDPLGLSALIEYNATLQPSEEQAKAHARYVNGVAPSSGVDRAALFDQSLFSAATDQIIVDILAAILLRDIPEQGWKLPFGDRYTFGIGTVLHLQTNTMTKGVSLNNFQWSKLAFNLARTKTGFLKASILAIIGSIPGGSVDLLTRGDAGGQDIFDPETSGHAEIIIARWGLAKYGSYPTPHRMLDIATSRNACMDRGPASCAFVLPTLRARQYLLFEMTLFPSLVLPTP